MLVKTSELTGAALDWAVAKCEGKSETGVYGTPWLNEGKLHLHYCDKILLSAYDPSTDWKQGGPIIERERITLRVSTMVGTDWIAFYDAPNQYPAFVREKGSTPLIAAMRCYVASKFGDTVEIPDDLMV